jgi:transcriptional regulator with XRE-family HTH domain
MGPPAFGALLRAHRLATGATQEVLAERAGVSLRAIQHLERGDSRPTRGTFERLAEALELSAAPRAAFAAAAAPARHRPTCPRRGPPSWAASARSPTWPTSRGRARRGW